jgi:hypothetical protein
METRFKQIRAHRHEAFAHHSVERASPAIFVQHKHAIYNTPQFQKRTGPIKNVRSEDQEHFPHKRNWSEN